MPTQLLGLVAGLVPESATTRDEKMLAAVLDSCIARMSTGCEPVLPVRPDPEVAAEIGPLLEVAALLSLRGRLTRNLVA